MIQILKLTERNSGNNDDIIGKRNLINTKNYMIATLITELEKYDKSIVSLWKGASEKEIEDSETHIGQELPKEYKEFVRISNGLEFTCDYILRVGNNVTPSAFSLNWVYDFEHFESNNPMPSHIIPFVPDGYGNHYCFDMKNNGVIIFWQHDINYDEQKPEIVYKSMFDMINEVFIDWSEINYDGTPKL